MKLREQADKDRTPIRSEGREHESRYGYARNLCLQHPWQEQIDNDGDSGAGPRVRPVKGKDGLRSRQWRRIVNG